MSGGLNVNDSNLLEGEMTGDLKGDSRWLSVSGRQNAHSLMLQKFRRSPSPLPGRPLKSKRGDNERRMLRAAVGLSGGRLKSVCSDSVTSTVNVVWTELAITSGFVCLLVCLLLAFSPTCCCCCSSKGGQSNGLVHPPWSSVANEWALG